MRFDHDIVNAFIELLQDKKAALNSNPLLTKGDV